MVISKDEIKKIIKTNDKVEKTDSKAKQTVSHRTVYIYWSPLCAQYYRKKLG